MLLTNEQSRQLIDIGHDHAARRAAQHEFVRSFRYAPRWRSIAGSEYFYIGETSHGVRSQKTQDAFAAYGEARQALQARLASLRARLENKAPVNVALRLGRVPKLPARILRALDAEGLLGKSLRVIGTHALFAYEIAAGEFFESDSAFKRRFSSLRVDEPSEALAIEMLRGLTAHYEAFHEVELSPADALARLTS